MASLKRRTEEERRSALVDELGAIQDKLAPYKLVEQRRKQILEEIQQWPGDLPAAAAVHYRGTRYVAQVSAREMQQKPVIAKVFAKMGKLKFLAVCKVTIKAIEDAFCLEEREGLIVKTQDGPRSVKVAPLEAIEARMQERQAA